MFYLSHEVNDLVKFGKGIRNHGSVTTLETWNRIIAASKHNAIIINIYFYVATKLMIEIATR